MWTLEPDKAAHRLALADFFWKTDQQDKAAEVLDELAAMQPDPEKNTIAAAQFYMKQNEVEQATKMLKDGIAANPSSYTLREALAQQYVQAKDTDRALAVLKESLALSKDPADPGILTAKTKMAEIHMMRREPEMAKSLVDEVLAENPKSAGANYVLGQLHLAGGRGDEAVTAFRTVVAENPEARQRIPLSRSGASDQQGGGAGHRRVEPGLQQNPSSKEIRRALARVYMAQKDYSAAEKQLTAIIEMNPDDLRAMGDLGDFKLSRKEYDSARLQYDRIIEKAPTAPGGYLKLARLHDVQDNRDAALAVLEKGYAAAPNSLPMLAALVKANIASKKIAAAESLCREKIVQFPDNPFTYNLLAQVQLAAKQPEGSRSIPEKGHRTESPVECAPQQPGPALPVPGKNRPSHPESAGHYREESRQYRRQYDAGVSFRTERPAGKGQGGI